MRSGWKVSKLVQTGEGLVASAATSLTNPKVLAHLDLVKTGLVDSRRATWFFAIDE